MAVETMCYLRCCLFGDSVEDSYPRLMIIMAAWRNGIASDYESGDCRFDPCGGQKAFSFLLFPLHAQLLKAINGVRMIITIH